VSVCSFVQYRKFTKFAFFFFDHQCQSDVVTAMDWTIQQTLGLTKKAAGCLGRTGQPIYGDALATTPLATGFSEIGHVVQLDNNKHLYSSSRTVR
jgi:hypothetical protein